MLETLAIQVLADVAHPAMVSLPQLNAIGPHGPLRYNVSSILTLPLMGSEPSLEEVFDQIRPYLEPAVPDLFEHLVAIAADSELTESVRTRLIGLLGHSPGYIRLYGSQIWKKVKLALQARGSEASTTVIQGQGAPQDASGTSPDDSAGRTAATSESPTQRRRPATSELGARTDAVGAPLAAIRLHQDAASPCLLAWIIQYPMRTLRCRRRRYASSG